MDTEIAVILLLTIVPPVLLALWFAANGRRLNREWRARTRARRAARHVPR